MGVVAVRAGVGVRVEVGVAVGVVVRVARDNLQGYLDDILFLRYIYKKEWFLKVNMEL